MPPRRRYLVTYDVSDDKRRTQVYRALLGAGDHVQYSVFFCDLNPAELATLRKLLRPLLNNREDQLLFVELGPAADPIVDLIEVLGRGYEPPVRTLVV